MDENKEKKRRIIPSAVSIQVDQLLASLKNEDTKQKDKENAKKFGVGVGSPDTISKPYTTAKTYDDGFVSKKNKAAAKTADLTPKKRGAPSKPMNKQKWTERLKYRNFRSVCNKTADGLDIFELVDPNGLITHHSYMVDGEMQFFDGCFDWTNIEKQVAEFDF